MVEKYTPKGGQYRGKDCDQHHCGWIQLLDEVKIKNHRQYRRKQRTIQYRQTCLYTR